MTGGLSYRADPSITGVFTTPDGTQVMAPTRPSGTDMVISPAGSGDCNINLDPIGVGRVKVEGGNIVGYWVSVPATATSTGKTGQMAADSSWLYICTAANTWRRVAVASW